MSDLMRNTHFQSPSREDWIELVEKGLKDRAFETLSKFTDDDLKRGPLSTQSDRTSHIQPIMRTMAPHLDGRPWHVCAPVRDPDIAFANTQVLDDLKGGASALDITITSKSLSLRHASDLKRLLEGVYLNLVPIKFDIRHNPIETAKTILSYKALSETPIDLGLDPLGLSLCGISEPFDVTLLVENPPENVTALCANAALVYEAGGTEAQELSVMAASVAHYWRTFGPQTKLSVKLAADQDGHLGISKIRAARWILNRLASAFETSLEPPIHSVTGLRMMQTLDPWTNLLRVMSAGFGAVCGGADYITLRPFTDAQSNEPRLSTPFGYRIARNMQMMMMEESYLGQVNDPAFGSYFHERMAQDLAHAAWTEFQAIEAGGGIQRLIETGTLRDAIKASKANRDAKNDPILGVSLHAPKRVRPAELREI